MEINPIFEQRTPKTFGHGNQKLREVVDMRPSATRFYGRPLAEGTQVRKWEQPWHNNAAYMLASGKYSMKAVAQACEKCVASVGDLMKNAWFQEQVKDIQRAHGAEDVMSLFRAECTASLVTFVQLRDDVQVPASVRHNCAKSIIEQVLGKPTQRVETTDVPHSDDVVAEVERLEKENSMLQHRSASSSEFTVG